MTVADQNSNNFEEQAQDFIPRLRSGERLDPNKLDLREEVVSLNRVAKVVKGGRRFSFSALVVVGDGAGHVGVGFGKANEVPDAIQKAIQNGRRNLITVPIVGRTITHEIIGEFGAGRVLLKPASEGTGLIAGPAARAILEMAGVRDCLTKVLGSDNQINVIKAVYAGLKNLATAEKVAALRGKSIEELFGKKAAERYLKGREEALNAKPDLSQTTRVSRSPLPTYSAGGRDGEGGRGGDSDKDNKR